MNSNPAAQTLFPELEVPPTPVAKKRVSKKAATQAAPGALAAPATNPGLLPQPVSSGPVCDPGPGITPGPAAPVPAIASGTPPDMEQLARLIEAHPDYRLLRRLQPRLDWPAPDSGGVLPGDTACVLLLDTETTGLDCERESIIELAMLRVQVHKATGLPVGTVEVFDELEDPGKPIPKEVVALTGIQDHDVAGKALDEARIARMLEGVDLVIAHNAAFDRPFVESRLPAFAWLPWSCSFADINWKAQGRSSSKLESLAQGLGWFYDAHRAEMDCHALLAVLAAPLPEASQTGLAVLLQAATVPAYRVQATNAPFDAKDKLKARGYRWNAEQRVWHTRLGDAAALQDEFAWLKEHAYGNRAATVQVETLDALAKYARRTGKSQFHPL